MAWYYGTYSCGHEGRVNIIGPTKDRQWKVDRHFEKMCPECYEKYLEEEREKANNEAAEKAKEMELPKLIGTEKQIAWANTLRQDFIEKSEKINAEELKRFKMWDEDLKGLKLEEIPEIVDYILITKNNASYWIDNRNRTINLIVRERGNALKTDEEILEEKTLKEIKLEATIFPQNSITNVAAEITVKEDRVTVIFEKNESFRLLVKSLGYKWEGIWAKKINELTGSAEDRAAELGNKLLNAGFPVMILDEKIRENAVNGIYEPECNRWINLSKNDKYKGWLAIIWYDGSDLYNKARKLPGSKWSNPAVVVKVEYYKEVEEFARLYDFKFTTKALKAIDDYKEALKNITVVNPIEIKEIEHKDGLEEILNSSTDILDDLKED